MEAEREKGRGEAELGEEFGEADFAVAVATFASENKPRKNGEVVVPLERMVAVEADRAGTRGATS